jgi:peptidyl-prolyl cis-trans isomerase C
MRIRPHPLRRNIPPLLMVAALGTGQALAQQQAGDAVLVENAKTTLTRTDYETELSRLPPELRGSFGTDPRRVQQLLNVMLVNKTLAAEARAAGADRDPAVQRRIALELDRFLAQVALQRLEDKAGAEFDARSKEFEARARELYLVDKAKYQVPETVSASHILLDPKAHGGDADTLKLAQQLRAKVLAGEDFAALARAHSDDPTARTNGGRLDYFEAGRMDPEFSKAAFALQKPGDVSEPVRSQFGYHVIRLEGRRPARAQSFEEVKPQIMADLRKRYLEDAREQKLAAIRNDPTMKVNQPAVDALVEKIDPELARRPGGTPAGK